MKSYMALKNDFALIFLNLCSFCKKCPQKSISQFKSKKRYCGVTVLIFQENLGYYDSFGVRSCDILSQHYMTSLKTSYIVFAYG